MFVKLVKMAGLGALLVGMLAAPALAQKTKLTVYTALENDQLAPFKAEIEKVVPSVDIEWVRDSTGVITARFLAEKDNPKADMVMGLAASSLLAFKKAGLLAVPGLGSCPGIANVQARAVVDTFETVESIRIYNGATPDMGDSLAWAYSIQTIFDEITQPPMVFRDGTFQETAALGEEEMYRFQDPIGVAKVHLSLHSEVATLPLTYGPKGIKDCFFKISFFGYSEKALRQLQFLAQIGMASTEPIEVRGARVRPRDVLLEVMKRDPSRTTDRFRKMASR